MTSATTTALHCVDAVIVGAGVAGLWAMNVLQRRGYRALMFESDGIGGKQTLASQGMIHGGLKYALRGRLTTASEAIADMPARWRACLEGVGDVDLSGLLPKSERYHLFAEASTPGAPDRLLRQQSAARPHPEAASRRVPAGVFARASTASSTSSTTSSLEPPR